MTEDPSTKQIILQTILTPETLGQSRQILWRHFILYLPSTFQGPEEEGWRVPETHRRTARYGLIVDSSD